MLDALGVNNTMGHINDPQAWGLFELVREHAPREPASAGGVLSICEIGFNVGHSATAMLAGAAAGGVRVAALHAFDAVIDGSVVTGWTRVREAFPDTHVTLTPGQSNDTVPLWASAATALQGAPPAAAAPVPEPWQLPPCDVIHIDGEHNNGAPAADWTNVQPLLRRDGRTLILFDDCACGEGNAWWCVEPTEVFDAAAAAGGIVTLSRGEYAYPLKGTCAGRAVPAPLEPPGLS